MRRTLVGLVLLSTLGAATVVGSSAWASGAGTNAICDTLKIADFDSPDVHLSYYAIDKGIVKDKRVGKIQVDYLSLPALIQATGSDRYDVTSTSLSGLIFARLNAKKDFQAIAFKQAINPGGAKVWVQKNSAILGPADLKGKTLGVTSLGSTNTMMTQIVLRARYGMDTKLSGGDIRFTELDPPTLLNAVENGQIDGGQLFYATEWQARKNPGLRPVLNVSRLYQEITGARFVGGVLIASPETLASKRDCIIGLQAMLRASAIYAQKHIKKLAPIVGKQQRVSAEYLKWWFATYDYGSSASPLWVNGAVAFWAAANDAGLLPARLTADQAVFRP
jgi:ABC-type nitrate/sulfonate/bicarbonate transport system substrate-binding protein